MHSLLSSPGQLVVHLMVQADCRKVPCIGLVASLQAVALWLDVVAVLQGQTFTGVILWNILTGSGLSLAEMKALLSSRGLEGFKDQADAVKV